jgi:iron complex transport system substrate-binding protein
MAPACTSIIAKLGLAGNIVACDTWSGKVGGVSGGAVRFDMMKPDAEKLAALEPDIVFVSALTKAGTSRDPFKPLSDAGVRVVYLPTSASIEEIRGDIARIAALLGREREAKAAIAEMDESIARISAIAKTIPEGKRRSVVFEIEPAPYIYSFGSGVYLDELLHDAGAINALAKETGWIAVSAEAVVAANPDVILTNVSSLPDPVAEIKSRPGWSGVKAVKEGRVYLIDGGASAQPGPGVAKALEEIAKAVYPEYFK